MVDALSKREKMFVLILYTILREDVKEKDFQSKLDALHSMLIACEIHVTDNEIEELVNLANDLVLESQGGAMARIYKELGRKIGADLKLARL